MSQVCSKYLSICAIFRDEAPYLREWIEFHRLVGVEHLYLYNNISRDCSHEVLKPYTAAGLVTLTSWEIPFCDGGQWHAYQHCLQTQANASRWIAFLDIDEFLFSPETDFLPNVLRAYERYPGIVVNWQCYGSSGHRERPAAPSIAAFTQRAKRSWRRNRRVKSIVDPRRAYYPKAPHFFIYRDGALAVTENEEPVTIVYSSMTGHRVWRAIGPIAPYWIPDPYSFKHSSVKQVSVNQLRINHYAVRSWNEFVEKALRYDEPRPGRTKHPGKYSEGFFRYHDRNEVEDPVLHRFLPALNRALAAGPGDVAMRSHAAGGDTAPKGQVNNMFTGKRGTRFQS